jgi:hypothetical protein
MPVLRRVLPVLLIGALVAAGPVHAQCSDCFVQGSDLGGLFAPSTTGPAEPRARAQEGDATAVLVEEYVPPMDADARRAPSVTISTPTAFGPGWGQVYGGVSYQDRIRYSDWHDGILAFGAGFGNPERTVGLAATVSVLDTYTEFAEDRSLSLKLHRRLPFRTALAVGYENVWHTEGTDGGSSRYAVASTVVPLRAAPGGALGSLVLSGGLGTDRFLAEPRFARGESGLNAFGSLAVRVLSPVNALVNWTGQDLNLGLSIVPHRALPVVLTPALLDVTGRAGDGARIGVSASLGYNAW